MHAYIHMYTCAKRSPCLVLSSYAVASASKMASASYTHINTYTYVCRVNPISLRESLVLPPIPCVASGGGGDREQQQCAVGVHR